MNQIARSPKQIGVIVQGTRKNQGSTQTDLANLTGLRQVLISKIETCHEGTKLPSLFALFAALNLDLTIQSRSGGSSLNFEDVF